MAKTWKRKDRDTWVADYRDAAGVRRRLTANSRQEAEQLLAEKVKESREGSPVELLAEDVSLAEYAERWIVNAATRLKGRTILSYAQLLRLHILPVLGHRRMREVHRLHAKALLAEKRESGLSKNTVRLIRACLSAMFAEALDDGLVKANPAALASRRRGAAADGISHTERHAAIRPFSEAELADVLVAARQDDHGYGALFLSLARTGMRPGEALALKWEDIDLGERELLVERALSAGLVGTTKTGHVRRIDISQELAAELSRLCIAREKQTLESGWSEVPEWVFCNSRGGLLDESRLRKRFARAMKRAGLSGHRLYDLRHTFATLLLARGVPITYVAAQLGHARPTTTLQWYAHWLPRNDKSFVDSLDQPVDKVGTKSWHQNQEVGRGSEKLFDFTGGPSETRTPDPLIKSQLLYQLS